MGGLEPAGGYVRELLRAGQAGRLREQAAARARRRRALRRRVGRRRAAPLRGVGLRGDPGRQGAARVARRDERPPRARHRQRDDELHPPRAWSAGGSYAEALAEAQRLGYAEADPTDDVIGRRRGREDGDSRNGRVRLARRARRTSRRAASRRSSRATSRPPPSSDMVVRLVGIATLVDGAVDVRVQPAFVDGAPSARRCRRRVQRRDAPGRRDPRDHARGAGRGRDGDRLRRRCRHRQRRSAPPAPASSRTTPAGARSTSLPPGDLPLGVLRPPRRRRPARRAGARRATASPSRTCRSRSSCSASSTAARRSTSSLHEAPARPRRGRPATRRPDLTEVRSPPEVLRVITERGF